MQHRHGNLFKIDALFLAFQLVRVVNVGGFCPYTIGEKNYCLLTY